MMRILTRLTRKMEWILEGKHDWKMERKLLRHENRMDNRCNAPNMISLTMNWKDWEAYYKVVNGKPRGEADKIFNLIAQFELFRKL